MDPIFIPGSGYSNSGTEIEPTSHSLSSTSYPHGGDDYGLKWKNGQDLIDSTIRPNDARRSKPVSKSPGSSIHHVPMGHRRGEESTVSSSHWNIRSPSGDQYRPEFPVSSTMVWDLLKTQDYFLDLRHHKKERPENLRSALLPSSLAELTPALLSTNDLLVDSRTEAEAIYDCLKRNKVVKSTNYVGVAYAAYKLEEMLTRSGIILSDFKLKKLEWLLGLLYDLDQFTREQFESIHDPVPSKFWKSYFKTEYSVVGAWFGRGGFGSDKPPGRTTVWSERHRYWDVERKWQREHYDADGQTSPRVRRSGAPIQALSTPKSSPQHSTSTARSRTSSSNSESTLGTEVHSGASVFRKASGSASYEGMSELSACLQAASIDGGMDKR